MCCCSWNLLYNLYRTNPQHFEIITEFGLKVALKSTKILYKHTTRGVGMKNGTEQAPNRRIIRQCHCTQNVTVMYSTPDLGDRAAMLASRYRGV